MSVSRATTISLVLSGLVLIEWAPGIVLGRLPKPRSSKKGLPRPTSHRFSKPMWRRF